MKPICPIGNSAIRTIIRQAPIAAGIYSSVGGDRAFLLLLSCKENAAEKQDDDAHKEEQYVL